MVVSKHKIPPLQELALAQQSALAQSKETNICFIEKNFSSFMSNYLRSEKILNLISMETLQLKLFRFNLHRRNNYWCRKLLEEGHDSALCQIKFFAEEEMLDSEYVNGLWSKNISNYKYKWAPRFTDLDGNRTEGIDWGHEKYRAYFGIHLGKRASKRLKRVC
ncbi:MAG: hypothetical protein ACKO7P_10490 [Bacteroidota bacterium]